MRSRSVLLLLAVVVAMSATVPLSVAAKAKVAAAPAKNGCGKGKALRQIAGKRSCVPAKAKRIRPATVPGPAAALARGLAGPILLRRKNGKPLGSVLSPQLQAVAVAQLSSLIGESEKVPAVAARSRKARTHESTTVMVGDVSVTKTVRAPTRVGEFGASAGGELKITRGNQSVTQGLNTSHDGKSLTQEVTFGATLGGASQTGGIGGSIQVDKVPYCPDGEGKIDVERSQEFRIRQALDVGLKGSSSMTLSSRWRATAQMSPDAQLLPFAFTVSVGWDEAASVSLSLFQGITRYHGTATMTGTMDPKTGSITQSSITVAPKFTSSAPLSSAEQANGRAATAAGLEMLMRDEPGKLLAAMRAAESHARTGRCTSLVVTPASPRSLQPGAKVTLTPDFRYPDRGIPVKWTATASKGTVTPVTATSTIGEASPTFTVTGAKTGPETANITFRAVSAAGISEATWIAKGTAELPAAYEGTFTVSEVYDGGRHEDHTGTFRWIRSAQEGRYELAGGSATLTTSGTVTGPCVIAGTKSGVFGAVAKSLSLLMVGDFSNPSAPIGMTQGGGVFIPPDPTRPVYISLVANFPGTGSELETFSCPAGASRSNIVSEPGINFIGTPFPGLVPDRAFSVATTTALDGTLTERAGVVVRTATWQLRAVPG